MAALAILIGIYSYLILALGLLGILSKGPVFLVSLPFLVLAILYFSKLNYRKIIDQAREEVKKDRLVYLAVILLAIQVLINLAGALSPELSFDALFYHLPIPKLYATYHRVFHIPGGLLYVSALPRLVEMLYTAALIFDNEIWAKLAHFAFGVLSAVILFKLLRRYFSVRLSVFGVLTFYTMLVVGWQSTTAYVELARTFFEVLSLSLFLLWVEEKKDFFLYEAGILTSLALATKIIAFGTLFAFLVLIFVVEKKKFLKKAFIFGFLAILTVSPWIILAWLNTGSPLFPLVGGPLAPSAGGGHFLSSLLKTKVLKLPLLLWQATLQPDDILSPAYLLFLPLVFVAIWRQNLAIKVAALYVLLGAFFAPETSNRYLLPYLPGATLVALSVFNYPWRHKRFLEKMLIYLIFFGALLNLVSRGLATRKFIPYLIGRETKSEFLSRKLNFAFGDFYDVDGWFAKNITDEHLVLIYNIHNLYYVDFPFVHQSWATPGTFFTHVLVGDWQSLPARLGDKPLIYRNVKTGVSVYLFGEQLK